MSNATRFGLPAVMCLLAAACSGGASAPSSTAADTPPVAATPPPPMQPTAEERFASALDELGAANTYRGSTVTFSTVKPAKGQWTLSDEDKARLDKVADLLKEHPETSLIIEGYTDSNGDRSANQRLSQKHAEAFEHALVADHGIDAQRVRSRGLGEENPAADNGDAAGRAKNQRVEMIFSAMNGQFAAATDNDAAKGGAKAKNST